ncbi:MAG: hypothetical protein AB1Z98_23315 [Nannocystaceae bacterium]
MSLAVALPTIVAGLLAFHPFGSTSVVSGVAQEPDPSWNEPAEPEAAEPEEGTEPVEGTETTDVVAPVEPVADPAAAAPAVGMAPVAKPIVSKGTGLVIGASVTGGLAWATAIGRLVAINRCVTAIESGSIEASGTQCIFQTGPALVILTPLGWTFNAATYGLAPAAGVIRGKHDGIAAAWGDGPDRNTGAFIGSGAGLLGLGVVGRVITFFTFGRSLSKCTDGNACRTAMRLHFVGAQLSSASIAAGAGLLGYGVAFKKNRDSEKARRTSAGLAKMNLRLAPQLGFDYQGLSLTGRF